MSAGRIGPSSVKWFVAALAGVVVLAAAFPTINFAVRGVNVAPTYAENIGFRYFLALRVLEGDFVNAGQGPLTGLIQIPMLLAGSLVYAWAPAEYLAEKLNLFGYLTNFGSLLVILFIFALILRDRSLSTHRKVLLLGLPLVWSYTYVIGYYANALPDHHRYVQPLYLAFMLLAFKLPKPGGHAPELRLIILMGIVLGLSLAQKPTTFIFPAAMFAAFQLSRASSRSEFFDSLRSVSLAYAIALVVYLALVGIFYRFKIEYIGRYWLIFYSYVTDSTGGVHPNPGFTASLLMPFESWSKANTSAFWWHVVAVLVGSAMLLVSARGSRDLRAAVLMVAAGIAVIAIYAVGMIRRGGDGSFHDTMMMVWPVGLLMISQVSHVRWRFAGVALATLFSFAYPLAWMIDNREFVLDNGKIISDSKASSAAGFWNRELYEWNRSHGVPIFLLMSNNAFIIGSVEDMMMRGFGDIFLGGWEGANVNPVKQKFFPLNYFIHWGAIPPDGKPTEHPARKVFDSAQRFVVVWTENPTPAEWPAKTNAISADLAAQQQNYVSAMGFDRELGTSKCRRWIAIGPAVNSCVVTR